MSLFGRFEDMGFRIAVDPAMPEGVVEFRARPGEPGVVMLLPGTPAEQQAATDALVERMRAQVRAGRNAVWSNDAQASLDRMTEPQRGDTP